MRPKRLQIAKFGKCFSTAPWPHLGRFSGCWLGVKIRISQNRLQTRLGGPQGGSPAEWHPWAGRDAQMARASMPQPFWWSLPPLRRATRRAPIFSK